MSQEKKNKRNETRISYGGKSEEKWEWGKMRMKENENEGRYENKMEGNKKGRNEKGKGKKRGKMDQWGIKDRVEHQSVFVLMKYLPWSKRWTTSRYPSILTKLPSSGSITGT